MRTARTKIAPGVCDPLKEGRIQTPKEGIRFRDPHSRRVFSDINRSLLVVVVQSVGPLRPRNRIVCWTLHTIYACRNPNTIRRRRAQTFDRYVEEVTREAAADVYASPLDLNDFDDEYHVYGNSSGDGGGGLGVVRRAAGSGGGYTNTILTSDMTRQTTVTYVSYNQLPMEPASAAARSRGLHEGGEKVVVHFFTVGHCLELSAEDTRLHSCVV